MTTKLPEPALTITTKLGYMVGGNSTTLRKGDKLYSETQLHQVRREALEEAARECAELVDTKEEARSEKASHDAKGTEDELPRLRHWATVSTYNSGVRRCVSAIRALAGKEGER